MAQKGIKRTQELTYALSFVASACLIFYLFSTLDLTVDTILGIFSFSFPKITFAHILTLLLYPLPFAIIVAASIKSKEMATRVALFGSALAVLCLLLLFKITLALIIFAAIFFSGNYFVVAFARAKYKELKTRKKFGTGRISVGRCLFFLNLAIAFSVYMTIGGNASQYADTFISNIARGEFTASIITGFGEGAEQLQVQQQQMIKGFISGSFCPALSPACVDECYATAEGMALVTPTVNLTEQRMAIVEMIDTALHQNVIYSKITFFLPLLAALFTISILELLKTFLLAPLAGIYAFLLIR